MPNTKNLSGEIIEIKVKPYLKDYFIQRLGGVEPIPATIQNKIMPFPDCFLTHKPKNWKPHRFPPNNAWQLRCFPFCLYIPGLQSGLFVCVPSGLGERCVCALIATKPRFTRAYLTSVDNKKRAKQQNWA